MAKLLTGTRIYGTGTVDTQLFVSGTNASTSTTTGALQVIGGVGVGGNLNVGGTIYGIFNGSVTGTATTATNIAGGTPGQVPYQTAAGVTSFYGPGTAGNVLVSNGTAAPTYNNTLTLIGVTAATSTSTGALQVRGGVGVGGYVYAGGMKIISPNTDANVVGTIPFDIQGAWMRIGDFNSNFDPTNGIGIKFHDSGNVHYSIGSSGTNFVISQTSTNGEQLFPSGRTDILTLSNTGIVTVNATTAASATNTGALLVLGGVGIGRDLFVGGNTYQVGGTYGTLATTFNLINTTATTVNFAGAATTLNVGATSGSTTVRNNLSVTGNLTVQGTTTIVDSTVTNVADPIITLGGGAGNTNPTVDDNKDRGIAFKWVNNGGTTSTGFFGYDDSTGYLTYIQTATITNEVVSGTKGAVDANLAGGTAMSLVYQSAANATAFLAASTSGFILQTNGTGSAPTWVNASGIGAGSATNADAIRTIATTTNAVYYPTFVDSNNASNAYESLYTTSSFSINAQNGTVIHSGIIPATSTSTGALQVVGGVGIGGTLYVGNLRADATTSATTWGIYYNTVTKELTTATAASGSSTGTTSTFVINNSTAATSTNTGALQVVNGGAGIGGSIYAGGDIFTRGTKVIPLNIQEFTATAGQITFTISGGYTVGTVQVFANGINLDSTDFAASNGTTVVVAEPRAVNDRIKIVSGGTSSAMNNAQNFSIAMSVALSM